MEWKASVRKRVATERWRGTAYRPPKGPGSVIVSEYFSKPNLAAAKMHAMKIATAAVASLSMHNWREADEGSWERWQVQQPGPVRYWIQLKKEKI